VQREQIFEDPHAAMFDADDDDRPRLTRRWSGVVPILVGVYLAFTVFGVVAFHIPGIGVVGQELSFRRLVFAAVNATTLTGFQQDVGSSLVGAEILRLILTLGGTLFTLTVGGIAVARVARMRYSDGQVALGALIVTAVTTIGGAAFLLDAQNRTMVPALLQAASAFGNSGLYAGRLPGVLDWQTHAVLLPLAFLGTLGVPVLMEVFDRVAGGRKLSTHSKLVFVLSAAFYAAGFLLLAVVEEAHSGEIAWRQTLARASVFSIDARTAGLPFEFARNFARTSQWLIVALMIVGGSPGGTASGLKTTTFWRLFTGVRDNLRGYHVPRSFGVAACWIAGYFAIVLLGFLLLLKSEPEFSVDQLLFLCVSAVSNVGLSHDPISITGNGLFTLSAMMLAGRLAPLAVLWWLANTGGDDGEPVAVG
jgi:hypothetical protein